MFESPLAPADELYGDTSFLQVALRNDVIQRFPGLAVILTSLPRAIPHVPKWRMILTSGR